MHVPDRPHRHCAETAYRYLPDVIIPAPPLNSLCQSAYPCQGIDAATFKCPFPKVVRLLVLGSLDTFRHSWTLLDSQQDSISSCRPLRIPDLIHLVNTTKPGLVTSPPQLRDTLPRRRPSIILDGPHHHPSSFCTYPACLLYPTTARLFLLPTPPSPPRVNEAW